MFLDIYRNHNLSKEKIEWRKKVSYTTFSVFTNFSQLWTLDEKWL